VRTYNLLITLIIKNLFIMKKVLLILFALFVSASLSVSFAADPAKPDLLAQGFDSFNDGASYDAATKTVTFPKQYSNAKWEFWGNGGKDADKMGEYLNVTIEFEPVDFAMELIIADWRDNPGWPAALKKSVEIPAGQERVVVAVVAGTEISIQSNVEGEKKLKLKAAFLSKYPDFISSGKVFLSQLNEYADDAIATLTIIATDVGGWGPGWGVGRISDIGYVKDYKDTPFTRGITLIATSPEGSINTYEYTVEELKAIAKILPADLEALKAGALTTDPPKVFDVDWRVGDDNSIIRIYRDKEGEVTGEEAGLMYNIWGSGKRVSMTFKKAPPTFVLDFESDAIGKEYPAINADNLSAKVEARPAGEGKALHLIHSNWNAYPLFSSVKLPKGYTLGDVEKMNFELYYESVEPAGGQTPNSYKSFNYFFGEPGTAFVGNTPTGSASNIVAGAGDNPEKKWLKKQFVPKIEDEDLLALNVFDFGFGMGINEAGNYFLDNITFVLKEKEIVEPGDLCLPLDGIGTGGWNQANWESDGNGTIIFKNAWDGAGWGFWNERLDASAYNKFVLDFEPLPCYVNVKVEYDAKDEDGKELGSDMRINKDGTMGEMLLNPAGSSSIKQIWIQPSEAVTLVLKSACFLAGGTGITTVKPVVSSVYNLPGGIGINAANEKVSIYGIDGRLVKQVVANRSFVALSQGIYIVKVGAAKPVKVLVK
jgi:hypothetical protein